ncbi:glycosyltransferase family 2 protein [Ruminococcaceae bacterium OttesenSCG-928-A16]|nr:glycosyltransferase family 2 protein [Ruminococcaceae bacterium OttesenSCG-928-A16]
MLEVSAAVVMYGGAKDVRQCLNSLNTQTKGCNLCVYLVDNASPDGALATLEQEGLPPNVTVLPQPQNLGFGRGHNTVLPLLQSRYHAVVNPDIVVTADTLTDMAAWMDAHPDVAIATPGLVFPGGQPQHIGKRKPALLPLLARQTGLKCLKKYEDHYLMLDEDLSKPIDVEFCSGSFFMMPTEIFKKIGGFDEKYFMYVEDADITQKALQHGRAVYLPQFTVVHAWHRAAHRQLRQFVWQLRSMLRYFGKWGFRLK